MRTNSKMEENPVGPSWLFTWQAICDQEAQAKVRYKKFLEEWYKIETRMKVMDLRVDAMLKLRDEYLTHLLEKYPNWKPSFASYGLRSSNRPLNNQTELFNLVETEIIRSLRQTDEQRQSNTFHSFPSTNTQFNTFSGPLLPTYQNYTSSYRHTAPYANYPSHLTTTATGSSSTYFPVPAASNSMYFPTSTAFNLTPFHNTAFSSEQPSNSQITELKTEMSQIKSRLEDITVYLRELRHSAIELTSSVSRQASMRDKNRKGMSVGVDTMGKLGSAMVNNAENVMKVEGDKRTFSEQVKTKLVEAERAQKTRAVHSQDDEESDFSDMNYGQQLVQHDIKPKLDAAKETHARKSTVVMTERAGRKEREEPKEQKGPRFNFASTSTEKSTVKEKAEVVPSRAVPPPAKDLSSDDSSSSESDSPPTASWLMSAGMTNSSDRKTALGSTINPARPSQSDAIEWTKKPVTVVESSPESSPGRDYKFQPKTESGYMALLGAASKGQSTNDNAKRPVSTAPAAIASKQENSDSDDLDDALATATKSPKPKSSIHTKKSTETRDLALSDIFSFGKTDTGNRNQNTSIVEKPKSAPAPVVKQTEQASLTNESVQSKGQAAEPDDFLRKLFPDKFASNTTSATGGIGKGTMGIADEGRKKKTAFFMGDDSDEDIDLPQGNQKDDLDDFFFK